MSRLTLVCRLVFLVALIAVFPGCADSRTTNSDSVPDLTPVPSHEDQSHGWGVSAGSQ